MIKFMETSAYENGFSKITKSDCKKKKKLLRKKMFLASSFHCLLITVFFSFCEKINYTETNCLLSKTNFVCRISAFLNF